MADNSLTVSINGQDNLSGELKRVESGVIRFVGAVSAALTALSTIGFPVVSAANFQKELLNAAKTTNYTRDQLASLRDGLDDLSKQANVSAVDLAKIATLGGQLGIGADSSASLLEFVKQISVAITALDIPAEEAVDSIGKLINIFNVPASEFKNLVSSLNEVSNSSTATASQLFDVVRRIGNLGGSVSLPQAAALSASMIDLGLTAETAGTTITKIFADMKSNASAFANVAVKSIEEVNGQTKVMRYSTEEWVRLVASDGLTALKAYVAGLNELGDTQAAQIKSQLTGEGRLFEAVTKLQQQQKRQAVVQRELANAEQSLAAMRSGTLASSKEQIAAEEERVSALKSAAVQTNVLDRLNAKAQEAFRSGDSATREQATTMAGLLAQWQRFANNLTSLVNTVGGVLLSPLTDSLRSLSDQLQAGGAGEQLKAAAQTIVESVRRIGDGLAYLRTFTEGWGGIDWGALLRAGALVTAMVVFKALTSVFGVMGRSAMSAVPGLSTLADRLLGVSAASQEAAVRANEAAAAQQRQGGWLTQANSWIKSQLDTYLNATKALTDARDKAARVGDTAERNMLRSQTALAASMQQLPAYANTVLAAQQRITAYEQQRDAALQAGNRRSAAGYQSQITSLQNVLGQIQRNEQAVAQYTNQMALASRAQAKANQKIDAITVPFKVATGNVATVAAKAAIDFKTAFASAIAGGANPLAALSQALASATGPVAASGMKAGKAYIDSFRTAVTAGASSALTGLMALLGLSEFGDKWDKSTTKTAKGLTLLSGGFSALASLGRIAFGVLNKFVGFVFFAMMAKELLDLMGLWDKFLGLIGKLVVAYNGLAAKVGLPQMELPDFLKPKDQIEAATKATEGLVSKMQKASEEAAKFGQQQQANLALLRTSASVVQKDLTFNKANPGDAAAKAKEYLQSLVSGYSRAEVAAAAYATTEQQLRKAEVAAASDADLLAKARAKSLPVFDKLAAAEARVANLRAVPGATDAGMTSELKQLADLKKEAERASLGFAHLTRAASESGARLSSLKSSVSEFSKELAGIGGDGDNPYIGLDKAASNLASSLFNAEEATALFGSMTAGQKSPMQQWTQAVLSHGRAIDDLAAAEKKQRDLIDTKGRSESAYLIANAEVEAARSNLEATKKEVKDTATAAESLGRSREAVRSFMEVLSDTKNPEAMTRSVDAMVEAVKKLPTTAFKGLAVPEVKADSLISAASIVAVKTRVKSMYDSWSAAATIAADRAKNAATTAMAEVERLARQAQATAEKITQAYASNQAKAKRQVADRGDDAQSRQTLRNIQTEYDIERALIERNFSTQKNYMAEMEAGGQSMSTQKAEMYAMEQQAVFALDEKYNALREKEQDRANIQKQKRGLQDEIKAFDELIKKIDYYKKRVEESNRVLSDPAASLEKKAGAIEQRNVSLDKMKSLYAQLEAAGERIATAEPIGGQMIVDPAQVEKVKASLTDVATAIGKVGVEGSDKIEPVFKALATQFSNVSNTLSREIEVAGTAFAKMSGASGAELDKLIGKYASLVAQNTSYAAGLEKIQSITQSGLANLGSISPASVEAMTSQVSKAITAAGDKTPINLTVDAQSLSNNIAEAIRVAAGGKITSTPISVSVSGEALSGMTSQIQANVKPKLQGEIEITKIRGANGQLSVTYPAAARGGFIADLVKATQAFAGGGKVRGPGTGTSDSILARVSHGEYVMDALTTSRFGSGFFASLQAAARGGYSMSFLRGLSMPQFSTGGAVGFDASAFSGIANDFKSDSTGKPKRDVVDVNLNVGGKRVTIQAEREQARQFVGILRTFEKG